MERDGHDGRADVDDQIGLFWVQASPVHVPRAYIRRLGAPVAVVNTASHIKHTNQEFELQQ